MDNLQMNSIYGYFAYKFRETSVLSFAFKSLDLDYGDDFNERRIYQFMPLDEA